MRTVERGLTAHVARASRKVVVVNGNPEVLAMLESALEGGRYDLLFADAGEHAYSLIKREQPDLVVLSVHIDELEGFQLLSMLKLDPGTRHIPVVTYTNDGDTESEADEEADNEGLEFTPQAPMRLH